MYTIVLYIGVERKVLVTLGEDKMKNKPISLVCKKRKELFFNTDSIFDNPLHPYAKALLEAAPVPDPRARRDRKHLIGGQVPSPINRPSGCFFRTRCPHAMDICAKEYPELVEMEPNHFVSCHLYKK